LNAFWPQRHRVTEKAFFILLCITLVSAVKEFSSLGKMKSPPQAALARRDAWCYALAALAGIGTGCADVAVDDLLFTALLVLMACMILGMLRPRWPWRWVIAVVIFIPLTELAAHTFMAVQPTRGQVYGSFLTALPGVAGAYGGAVVRRAIDNLRQGK
jgi:ABC-type multidrug transport system permease subunit